MRKLLLIISLISLTSHPLYAKRLSPEKTQLYKNKLDYFKFGIGINSGSITPIAVDENASLLSLSGVQGLKSRYVYSQIIKDLQKLVGPVVGKRLGFNSVTSEYNGYFLFAEGVFPNYLFGLRVQSALARTFLNVASFQSIITYFNTTDVQFRWYPGKDKNWVLYGAFRFTSFLMSYNINLEKVEEELQMFIPGSYFGIEREGDSGFAVGTILFGQTNKSIKPLTYEGEEEIYKKEGEEAEIIFPAAFNEWYISYNIAKVFYSLKPPGRSGYLIPRSSRPIDTFDDYMKFGFHVGLTEGSILPAGMFMHYQKNQYLYSATGKGADLTGFCEYRFLKKYLGVRLEIGGVYSWVDGSLKEDLSKDELYQGIPPMNEYNTKHMLQVKGELLFRIYPDQYSDVCLYLGPYFGFLINKKGPIVKVDEEGEEEVDEQSEQVIAEYPNPTIDLKRWNFGLTVGADYEFKSGFILGYKLSMAPLSPIECEGDRSKDHYSHGSLYLGFNFSKLLDLYSL